MNLKQYSISKSSFLKFEQCPKAFFLHKNFPYLRDKTSTDKKLTFKRGHEVGYFAQELFPGGCDVSLQTNNLSEAIELTQKLIAQKTAVIYEATFVYNQVLIMVDILCLNDHKYSAYEVKSSIRISETYIKDAYLQYYVLKHSLVGFEDLFLVSINPDYVREKEIDPKKLFRKRSVKLKGDENLPYFDYQIQQALSLLEKNTIPSLPIGVQCFKPYTCDFYGTCWKDVVTENSIFNLPSIDKSKLFEWFQGGVKLLKDLPNDWIEKENARKMKIAHDTNSPIIDREKIEQFLTCIQSPVAAMDMEIWNPAIPQLVGTKPFEQIPFLVCFQNEQNSDFYLSDSTEDDRLQFGIKLIELSKPYKTILVYDKTMEVIVINQLSQLFPTLQNDLNELKGKLVDVSTLFMNLSYYDPAFKGMFSLKTISSVINKDVQYEVIGSGLEAMHYYENFRLENDGGVKNKLKLDLLHYCTTDCLATLKLVEFLRTVKK